MDDLIKSVAYSIFYTKKGIQKLTAQNIQNEMDVKKEVARLTHSDGKYFWV